MTIKAMFPLKPVVQNKNSHQKKLSSSYSYFIILQQLPPSTDPFPLTFPLSKKDCEEVGAQWPFRSFPSLVSVSASSGSMHSVFLLFSGAQKPFAQSLTRRCQDGWAGELIWPREREGDAGVYEILVWPWAKFCFHQLLSQTLLMRWKLKFLTSLVPLTKKTASPNPIPTVNLMKPGSPLSQPLLSRSSIPARCLAVSLPRAQLRGEAVRKRRVTGRFVLRSNPGG